MAMTEMRYQVRVGWSDGGSCETAAFSSREDAGQWVADVWAGRLTTPLGYVRCPSGAMLLGPREGMESFALVECR